MAILVILAILAVLAILAILVIMTILVILDNLVIRLFWLSEYYVCYVLLMFIWVILAFGDIQVIQIFLSILASLAIEYQGLY